MWVRRGATPRVDSGSLPRVVSIPSSSQTRRALVDALLVQGHQTAKLVVDPARLGTPEVHGFPESILQRYPAGIPLDLNPRWPLELDLESDRDAFFVSLSFSGAVCRCRVPWRAITIIGVGFGGVAWEHEREDDPEPPKAAKPKKKGASKKGGHLRLVT